MRRAIYHPICLHLIRGVMLCVCLGAGLLASACEAGTGSASLPGGLAPGSAVRYGQASLAHVPVGTAALAWSASRRVLRVTLVLTGLAPGSGAALLIVRSDCAAPAPTPQNMVYSLGPVTADANGRVVDATLPQSNVRGGIQSDWAIVVTTPDTNASVPLACGAVPAFASSGLVTQASVTLGPTSAPEQNVAGTAQLQELGDALTVTVDAAGFTPHSRHAAALHLGSCAFLSYTLYDLPPLDADGNGIATAHVTIHHAPALPSSGWYVMIENSAAPGAGTRASEAPIACGDVAANAG
jgi:hypothetical protein